MADLEDAIQLGRQAVDATPLGHPDRTGCLNNLGNRQSVRYARTRAMTDQEQATECFIASLHQSTSPVRLIQDCPSAQFVSLEAREAIRAAGQVVACFLSSCFGSLHIIAGTDFLLPGWDTGGTSRSNLSVAEQSRSFPNAYL